MDTVLISKKRKYSSFARVNSYLGFRPFFLGASVFSCVAMIIWLLVTRGYVTPSLTYISLSRWHAHEMLYGYTIAVVAGFLLTAVENWTGHHTLRGYWLLLAFLPWLIARGALIGGDRFVLISAISDLFFFLVITISIARSILVARQWKQIGILSKLVLLGIGNGSFYLGALQSLDGGVRISQIIGVYVLAALILTIGFRVLPRFIEIALNLPSTFKSDSKNLLLTLILFLVLFANHLMQGPELCNSLAALFLVVCITYRLYRIYHPRIFTKPLLWGLYSAIIAIDAGFLIEAIAPWYSPLPNLHIHAYAVGGIGLSTISMMSRVTLGHTGRSVLVPPTLIGFVTAFIGIAFLSRVLLPFLVPTTYSYALIGAQISWIFAFIGFLVIFLRPLVLPRQDGMEG